MPEPGQTVERVPEDRQEAAQEALKDPETRTVVVLHKSHPDELEQRRREINAQLEVIQRDTAAKREAAYVNLIGGLFVGAVLVYVAYKMAPLYSQGRVHEIG